MRQRRAVFALGGARQARVLRRTATTGFGSAKIPAGGLLRRDCRSLRLRGAPHSIFASPGSYTVIAWGSSPPLYGRPATELGSKLPRARDDDDGGGGGGGGGGDDDDRPTDRPTGPEIWCQELARDLGEVTRSPPEYARVGLNQSLPPRTLELEVTLVISKTRLG